VYIRKILKIKEQKFIFKIIKTNYLFKAIKNMLINDAMQATTVMVAINEQSTFL
jgi:hypothetical protein